MTDRGHRAAQWATGHTGTSSLRSIVEHPDLELVAARVYTDRKVGNDAGSLSGTDPTGITATDSIDDVLAAESECAFDAGRCSTTSGRCRSSLV